MLSLEMRKAIIILLSLCSSLFSFSAVKKAPTPKAVTDFINCIEQLQSLNENQREEAFTLRKQTKQLFSLKNGDQGFNIDKPTENVFNSELYFVGLGHVTNAQTYCLRLFKYLYEERVLKISSEVLFTETLCLPDANNKDEPKYYETNIKKMCQCNNTTKTVWQTYRVPVSSGVIDRIYGYDQEPAGWDRSNPGKHDTEQTQSPSTPSKPDDEKEWTEDDFLYYAARYYKAKDYSSAATILTALTSTYPANAEAWFRLAVLVKYKTKWSKKNYKDPNKTAIEFMKKAASLANDQLKKKAENALYYWEHPNYI